MLHSLSSYLSDAGIKIHQINQFNSSWGTLVGSLVFTLWPQGFQLILHILVDLKQTPVEAGCLVTDNRCLSCGSFPSYQGFLWYPVWSWWGRSQSRVFSNMAITTIQLCSVCAPRWDDWWVNFVVGKQPVPLGLWLCWSHIFWQATGLWTTEGITLNQSSVQFL